jgi:hypothetical protein
VALDAAQRLAVEGDRARTRAVDAGDGIEAGGLARPVGSDQAEDLAAFDREADRVQRGQAAELDGEILGLQQGFTLRGVDVAMQGGHALVDHRIGHAAALLSSAAPNSLRADLP